MALPGVRLLNVHALGGAGDDAGRGQGQRRIQTCQGSQRPKLLGVTILTSMDNAALEKVGIHGPPLSRVVKLARLAKKAGLDGVVASPQEVRAIRRACGKDFLIVVPGVRPVVSGGQGSKGKQTPTIKRDSRPPQRRFATARITLLLAGRSLLLPIQ